MEAIGLEVFKNKLKFKTANGQRTITDEDQWKYVT